MLQHHKSKMPIKNRAFLIFKTEIINSNLFKSAILKKITSISFHLNSQSPWFGYVIHCQKFPGVGQIRHMHKNL